MDCKLNVEMLPETGEIENKAADVCPVDWAQRVADVARMNHCGKSVMCRDGMNQLYTVIADITTEKGKSEDIELIRDICAVIKQSRGCGLAEKAAGLIDASLSLYSGEWDAHIRRKRCNAGVCKGYGVALRSEERRVGKECRSRWSPYH